MRGTVTAMVTPPHTVTDIAALYGTIRPLLLQIAIYKFKVPPDDAEALLHDVFLAFMRRQHHVRDLRPWLVGAICHACRYYWRRESHAARYGDGKMPEVAVTLPLDIRVTAREILSRLRPRDRCVLRLRYLDGSSFAEVATHLAVTQKRAHRLVGNALRRARRASFRRLSRPKSRAR